MLLFSWAVHKIIEKTVLSVTLRSIYLCIRFSTYYSKGADKVKGLKSVVGLAVPNLVFGAVAMAAEAEPEAAAGWPRRD